MHRYEKTADWLSLPLADLRAEVEKLSPEVRRAIGYTFPADDITF